MKKLVLLIMVALSLPALAGVKIGVINVQKVLSEIKEGKSIKKTLENTVKSKQKVMETEKNAINKMLETLKKQDKVLSKAAKAKKYSEIEERKAKARQMFQQYQQELQKKEIELMRPIQKKLSAILETVAKEAKVDMAIEVTTVPIAYIADRVDLTQKVIAAYNKKHSK